MSCLVTSCKVVRLITKHFLVNCIFLNRLTIKFYKQIFLYTVKRTLKLSACLNVMDKDLKANKKKAIEESQRSKLAQHDDGEDPVKLEGLTECV